MPITLMRALPVVLICQMSSAWDPRAPISGIHPLVSSQTRPYLFNLGFRPHLFPANYLPFFSCAIINNIQAAPY